MWSDECSVERRRGKRAEWVFRTVKPGMGPRDDSEV